MSSSRGIRSPARTLPLGRRSRPVPRLSQFIGHGARVLSNVLYRISTAFAPSDEVSNEEVSGSSIASASYSPTRRIESSPDEPAPAQTTGNSIGTLGGVSAVQPQTGGVYLNDMQDVVARTVVLRPRRTVSRPRTVRILSGVVSATEHSQLPATLATEQTERSEAEHRMGHSGPSGVGLRPEPEGDEPTITIRSLRDHPETDTQPNGRNQPAPQPHAPPRPLRREGAFHERYRPYWGPGSGYEPPEVYGRSAALLPENRGTWEANWGQVPHIADVPTDSYDGRPTPRQVIDYLNRRFALNRRAYYSALEILFPHPGTGDGSWPRIPVFRRVCPTARWRQDPDWEGGVVPVERQYGPARADDAADSEDESSEEDGDMDEDGSAAIHGEELRAIHDHVVVCLAAVPSTSSPSAQTLSDQHSSLGASGSSPPSAASSSLRKRSRSECEDAENPSSPSTPTSSDRRSVRRRVELQRPTSTSFATSRTVELSGMSNRRLALVTSEDSNATAGPSVERPRTRKRVARLPMPSTRSTGVASLSRASRPEGSSSSSLHSRVQKRPREEDDNEDEEEGEGTGKCKGKGVARNKRSREH